MKLDHPYDVCFKHSAISFGVPDMPPPDVGRSMGPISLHYAIGVVLRVHATRRASGGIDPSDDKVM